jgi:site-specific recombinase XerC
MQAKVSAKKTSPDTWQVYQSMFTDWLESVNAAPRTIFTYGIAVEQLGTFLRSHDLPLDPAEVTRAHLQEWMRYLQRPKDEGGQGVVAQTAKQRFRSTSRFFTWLADTDEIKVSPMAKMHAPQVPEKMVPVIKGDDLKKLFKVVLGSDFESRRDKAMISLFIDVGVRVGEMAGMDVADLDLGEREVAVLGKGRRIRRVRFIPETRLDIQRYVLKRGQHPHAGDAALWLGKRGRLTESGIYRMIVRRCDEAGIARTHPHAFRHTFAHEYLRAGGNEGDLMKVTGWRSRQMVDRYGASAAASRASEAHDKYSPRRGL